MYRLDLSDDLTWLICNDTTRWRAGKHKEAALEAIELLNKFPNNAKLQYDVNGTLQIVFIVTTKPNESLISHPPYTII